MVACMEVMAVATTRNGADFVFRLQIGASNRDRLNEEREGERERRLRTARGLTTIREVLGVSNWKPD